MCRFCEQAAFGQDELYDPQLGRGGRLVPGPNLPPDVILCDGPVLTMDPALPEASAVALREGVILAVGQTADLLQRRSRMTRVIRLDGRAIVPGFIALGAHLPAARDPQTVDAWVGSMAQAGFTTVDAVGLGVGWAEYSRLARSINRRHRLRLRGAAAVTLRGDWQDGALLPGQGNDLIRIDAVTLDPGAEDPAPTLARAQALHAEGWGVVFDCRDGDALTAAVAMAAMAAGRKLAGMRLVTAVSPAIEALPVLTGAGLSVTIAAGATTGPIDSLTGTAAQIAARLADLTVTAARSCGMSGIAGQIRPGLYADFTILDRSPFSPGAAPLSVTGTWIEGIPVRTDGSHVTI